MPVRNAEIADTLKEMGDLLAIKGKSPSRARAYRRAAQIVRGLPRELASAVGRGERWVPRGVSKTLAGEVAELLESGHLHALEELRHSIPASVRDLLRLPGMDAARVQALMSTVHVRNCADLERALAAGRLVGLRGFGRDLQWRLQVALTAKSDHAGLHTGAAAHGRR